MRRALLIALVLLLVTLAAPVARADRRTRGEEQLHQQLGAACRYPTGAANQCDRLDDYHLNENDVLRYEASKLHAALRLQRLLDDDVPMHDALWPHTHNSFNSEAYTPTLSRNDHNQLLSIPNQLRLDIRAIEIDVHRLVPAPGQPWQVVACHANEPATGPLRVHIGCTTEETLDVYLAELDKWLKANSDEVIILYLENHLEGNLDAHNKAVDMINSTINTQLAQRVFTPTGGGCQSLPIDLSRADIRAAGKQVLLTGNCGPSGSSWNGLVFERGTRWDESGDDARDDGVPTYFCEADRKAHDYDSKIIRRYEDRTWLSAMVGTEGGITKDEMTAMVGCGVNLVGFDMLHPDDPRLASLAWSWSTAEADPIGVECAMQRGPDEHGAGGGRWVSRPCNERHRAACFADGTWSVTKAAVPFAAADAVCHGNFDRPWNGWQNAKLAELKGGDVWVSWSEAELAAK